MPQGDVTRGMIQTVTDETNIIRDVSEVIDFLSPFDTPFLNLVGRDSLHFPCTQVKHEWLEDELMGRSGTLGAAYVAGSGTLEVSTDEGKFLVPDDIIQVEEGANRIVFRVTGGAPAIDVLTVTRIGGSTDTAFSSGSYWEKVSHAAQEGGEARADMTKTEIGNPYNYTQIYKDWAYVSGTMRVIRRYGYVSERAYQEEKLMRRLGIDLEKDTMYQVRSYSKGPPRRSTAGGLAHYVLFPGITNSEAEVHDAAAAAITENMLNDVLQVMWDNGGSPNIIVVNGTNKRYLTSWATPRIRTAQEERTAGASIGVYESDFGVLDILLHRWIRPEHVIIGARQHIGVGPLEGRQFSSRLLPRTGDYDRYEILGEYTKEVHYPSVEWGWIYRTKTTYS